jgi:SAM-dependent methyltransferase
MTNQQQAEYWAEYAQPWIEFEAEHELVTSVFDQPLASAAAARPGEHILDVGCGTGPSSRYFAGQVAPDGTVLGVDISAPMLAEAERLTSTQGVDNLRFRLADAQVDDLGHSEFDLAVSRLGVMFFSDPVAAFANIGRALKPSGRLAFGCFAAFDANEWMALRLEAVERVTGRPAPRPVEGEPGPFALQDHERTKGILTRAGYVDPEMDRLDPEVRVPIETIDRYIQMATSSGPIRRAFDENTDENVRQQILDAFRESLMARAAGAQVTLHASTWVVTAGWAGV